MSTQTQAQAPAPTFAVGERSIVDIIADLSKPLPQRHVRTRKQGGQEIPYIPWHTAVKYMDYFAPGWTYEIISVTFAPDRVAVACRVTIPTSNGAIWRDATGQELLNVTGYGDPTSNAEAQALKRAFAKFGLGLYLYLKEDQGGDGRGQQSSYQQPQRTQQSPRDVAASTPGVKAGGTITQKQLGAIRAICQQLNIDEYGTCKNWYEGKELDSLTINQASQYIKDLQSYQANEAQQGTAQGALNRNASGDETVF